jgi:hypothetical protein
MMIVIIIMIGRGRLMNLWERGERGGVGMMRGRIGIISHS